MANVKNSSGGPEPSTDTDPRKVDRAAGRRAPDRKSETGSSEQTETDRPARLPSLEFRTAAWLLECWARRCADDTTSEDRLDYLKKKLELVQGAVLHGQGTGKRGRPTSEYVFHEFEVVEKAVRQLFPKGEQSFVCWQEAGLRAATCKYKIELPGEKSFTASRPLFLEDATVSSLVGVSPDTYKGTPTQLAWELTGELFGIAAETVRKKRTQVRKEDRFPDPPSELQRFLVAAFMLKAREALDPDTQYYLLRILGTLLLSKYDAKGVYHLANYISSMKDDDRSRLEGKVVSTMNWALVDRVLVAYERAYPNSPSFGFPVRHNRE